MAKPRYKAGEVVADIVADQRMVKVMRIECVEHREIQVQQAHRRELEQESEGQGLGLELEC